MDTKKAEAGIRDPRNLLQLVLKDQVGQQDLRVPQDTGCHMSLRKRIQQGEAPESEFLCAFMLVYLQI